MQREPFDKTEPNKPDAPKAKKSLLDAFYEDVPVTKGKAAAPKSRLPHRNLLIGLICAVVVLLCVAVLLCSGGSKAVLTCDATGTELDNDQFRYYYWTQLYGIVSAYGDSVLDLLDPTAPLDEQMYDAATSWQDYLTQQALQQAEQTLQLTEAAREAGFDLTGAAAEQMAALEQTTQQAAADAGLSLKAYLAESFGAGASFESYYQYMYDTCLASAYAEHLYNGLQFTDEEIEAYYDAHDYEANYGVAKTDARCMDIRTIYFYPNDIGNSDDWNQAEDRAMTVLARWLEDPTEEHFAALADECTESAVAPAGGLYEGVYPGSQSEKLDAWLYGSTHAEGDCELVADADCWQLIYIQRVDERPYWMLAAENDLRYEGYMAATEQVAADYPVTCAPEHIVYHEPDGLDDLVSTPSVPSDAQAVG